MQIAIVEQLMFRMLRQLIIIQYAYRKESNKKVWK